ncbi:hypothetical protein RUM43_000558, partial [Polyplax serrata]
MDGLRDRQTDRGRELNYIFFSVMGEGVYSGGLISSSLIKHQLKRTKKCGEN